MTESAKAKAKTSSSKPAVITQQYIALDGTKFSSKNGMKKYNRQYKNKQNKRKKESASGGAGASANAKQSSIKECDLTPNQYFEIRKQMVAACEAQGSNMYPHKFEVTSSLPKFNATFAKLATNEQLNKAGMRHIQIAGRVMNYRKAGSKLIFYDLQADGASLQVVANAGASTGAEDFRSQHMHIRRGDIIGVRGYPGKTKSGQLSIFAMSTVTLAPCLKMLPSTKHGQGLTDKETRYRQRYLDLILRPKTREIFHTRAKIINYVRRFLDDRDFLEVETPMLNQMAGGAYARPFKTHHNELNIPMYLRIAPELYLKELIVGGLDRVYEIGRQFRNEGIDLTHNPEFTTCEFYAAYWDYNDLMEITEQLISGMVLELKGTYKVQYHQPLEHMLDDGDRKSGDDESNVNGEAGAGADADANSVEVEDDVDNKNTQLLEIDFTPPWRRYNMLEELESRIKAKIPRPLTGDECNSFLRKTCDEHEVDCAPPQTTARLIDKLVGHFIEDSIISPAFITCHPEIMSPLAKYHRDLPELTERFELFVAGQELCNAYTELNNPKVQRERFIAQLVDKDAGDEEAMEYDRDFCTAMEYALPPTGGWGLGIDRLTMFLTDSHQIKEVLLFPQMKPGPSHQ